ncbi:peptidoglycan-binding domain-containing protein [Streptomyces sp. VRA16 Mangrove soil]|uniref:peptidoglycan-binding domain-containing protein n=1 Tax=Streptomyces sp. VRA16 Mangrove soil TaxID=2817434 RepID=UPI0027DCA5C2|nr:peptidoglycan-binding domain-containing protein [Streptomyces sp. VRA16 Mangrove soil]
MKLKRTLASLGVVSAIALGGLTVGTTTAAATPSCSTYAVVFDAADYGVRLPTDSSRSNYCVMGQGASGRQVESLQEALIQCYGQSIEADGVFGPATATALKRAQAALGLTADGVYGPNTRDALKWNWTRSEGWEHRCLRLTQAPGPLR